MPLTQAAAVADTFLNHAVFGMWMPWWRGGGGGRLGWELAIFLDCERRNWPIPRGGQESLEACAQDGRIKGVGLQKVG